MFRTLTAKLFGGLVDTVKAERSSTYLQKKFDDHRWYTAAFIIILIPIGIGSWMFDYKASPSFADETIWCRLSLLWLLLPALSVAYIRQYKVAAIIVVLTFVAALLHALAISNTVPGIIDDLLGGFVIIPFLAVLLCVGFSIKINLLMLVLVFSLPLLLVAAGWFDGFSHQLYFLYMAQPIFALIFVMVMFSWNYYRRYVLERALEESSNTDTLTGVANRRHFNVLLQREVARCNRLNNDCALLMLDIDHFKQINDTFGHPSGDRVICALADICVDISRDTDVVARLGGEEFAIIMPGAHHADANSIAERIRQHIERLSIISDTGDSIKWTVSIGIASARAIINNSGSSADTIESVIRSADEALYLAKNNGRNRVVFYSEQDS